MRLGLRALRWAALAALLPLPTYAQGGGMGNMPGMQHDDPDKPVAGGGKLPEGWSARTDRDAPLTNVKFVKMGDGWHFTVGPAVVVYRASDNTLGNYRVSATFTQTKSSGSGHGEGFGLVIGGSDLSGPKQQYTYFLVRQDGMFLVKRRTGASTANVNEGWTENAALNKADSTGKVTDELAVAVQGGKASFAVNGKEVYSIDASKIDAGGIVGMRVNHNLDLHVAGFAVQKM